MNLDSPVSNLPSVGPVYIKRLQKLGIKTLEDLLLHIPHRYQDYRTTSDIKNSQPGEIVTIKGRVISIKNIYTRGWKKIQEAVVEDKTGSIQITWFNQTYLVKTIKTGEIYAFAGKVSLFNRKKSIITPEYESLKSHAENIHTGRLVPIYPATYGVSSKWLRSKVAQVLHLTKVDFEEFLPSTLIVQSGFENITTAINNVHFPLKLEDAERAKKRLAFDELLYHQLTSIFRKVDWQKTATSKNLKIDKNIYKEFVDSLDFELTNSQRKTIDEIFKDLSGDHPMNRLLEGDVGSGKTVVAAAAAFASFTCGYQTVVMAPTQILASQHFNTLKYIFDKFKVRVSLVTGSVVKSDLGRTDIFVGTHSLIHRKIDFENVALVVIDEQHRFGVEQRAHLVKKSKKGKYAPHILTMTATPIPRTVALTVYGDLDLSTLDELPIGRKPITTWIVPPQKREGAYGWIKEKIKKEKVQVFIICPLIEESSVETMKQVRAATKEYAELKKIFSGYEVGILHGRQSAKIKNEVLEKFKRGETDILVATPVVEVGIDVPNATIMIIEASERFGLAQLHQLRGRVGRGEKKSYCLCFTENRSPKVVQRLSALTKSLSGFELAELDLQMRGPGEIFGKRQHGFPELKIASWQDTELIKTSKKIAEDAIKKPKKYSKLLEKLDLKSIAPN